MEMLAGWIGSVVFLLLVIFAQDRRHRALLALNKAAEQESERRMALANEAYDLCKRLAAEKDEFFEAYKKMANKFETHLRFNEDVIKERDAAWDNFYKSALQAGSAQAWMLRELGHKIHELNKYREREGKTPVTMPAAFTATHEQFMSDFVSKKAPGAPAEAP